MFSRLNELCADIDRTASMGLFPHDVVAKPIVDTPDGDLIQQVDSKDLASNRDQALWQLVYRQTADARNRELPELLYTVATESKESVLRRSASWALLKLGETGLLEQCLRSDDNGNVHSWKQHLIYEAHGRTDWVDPRPVRAIESEFGFATTLPLTIHGVVQFRTPKSAADRVRRGDDSAIPYGAGRQTQDRDDNRAIYGPRSASLSNYRQITSIQNQSANPSNYDWHALVAGPVAQARLVGHLTAAVGQGSFYDNLTIQKVCTDPMDNGFDHVQGYAFRGMSRSLGGNAFAHYYTSTGLQPYYLSGHIGDTSEGVIDVNTQLTRHAETHIVAPHGAPYPYVQSVRGLFFGPARMNPVLAMDPTAPIDNLLQIIRDPYANGWFFGEFRSVPVDVDGDDTVELNGIEMYTDQEGQVVDRTPLGPQASNEFVR